VYFTSSSSSSYELQGEEMEEGTRRRRQSTEEGEDVLRRDVEERLNCDPAECFLQSSKSSGIFVGNEL
jgi:RNA recognition motif-containing protein